MTIFPETPFAEAAALQPIAVMTLLVLLVLRVLVAASHNGFADSLKRVFNIGMIPLLLAFALTALVRIAAFL